jgi:hypothetical protein
MAPIFKIHPAIGIARVGDSEDYYLAPEEPGGLPILPEGRPFTPADFRDAQRRLRRQGARFTLLRSDTPGGPEVEVRPGEGGVQRVEWTVHLANKKASWYEFKVLTGELGYTSNHKLRNADIKKRTEREKLIIDPGPRTLDGPGQSAEFNRKGAPRGYPVSFPPDNLEPCPIHTLGGLRTDSQSRLIVLGGHGRSGSHIHPASITDYANNDGWFDDTSDGPVTARIVFDDGRVEEAVPSWVMVAPPRYAPQLLNLVTLWDTVFDTSVRNLGLRPDIFADSLWNHDYEPSWERDILPILERAEHYPWVVAIPPKPHHFELGKLGDPNPELNGFRHYYLQVVRAPDQSNVLVSDKTGLTLMPYLLGDNCFEPGPYWSNYLTVTDTQYFFLQQWAKGKFTAGSPPVLSRGEALDRAALENCVGGAFSPGIEMTWISRNPLIYSEPFRLKHRKNISAPLSLGLDLQAGLEPGDACKFMALPWQADFNECSAESPQQNTERFLFWWPVQRPLYVYREHGGRYKQEPWAGTDNDQNALDYLQFSDDIQMVTNWKYQGFVYNIGTPERPFFAEVERVHPPKNGPDCGGGDD